jgi:hypothetical protein
MQKMDKIKITPDILLSTLKESMTKDQSLVYNVDKEACLQLELINLKQESYQKLFLSYVNNTCEEANKFNLENFLGKYYDICKEQADLKETIVSQAIGFEAYTYIKTSGKFYFQINLQIYKVIIRKTK